jgi:hypothetical protein
MIYIVNIWQTKYPEHPCMTAYEIEACAEFQARLGAQKKFQEDTGFKPEDTQSHVYQQPHAATDTAKIKS